MPDPVEKPTYMEAVKDRIAELASNMTGGMIGDTLKKMKQHHADVDAAGGPGSNENTASTTGRTGQSTDSWNRY